RGREAAGPQAGPSERPFGSRCSRAPAGAVRPAVCGAAWTSHHVVKRSQGGSDFDLDLLVALCRWCHDQTDAPYERGRLVVTALGAGQFTFEVITRVGPGTPPARVPAFALSTITKARGGQ